MFSTFIVTLIVAAVVVAYWRVVVLAAATLILAVLVVGIGAVSDAITGRSAQPAVGAPVQPGPTALDGEAIPKAEPPE